jgi:acetamidase/formamidase
VPDFGGLTATRFTRLLHEPLPERLYFWQLSEGIYLPVRVEGALFFTGDAHGNQGDGELCGVALEIPACTVLTFDLIKGRAIEWPRIEAPDRIMTVASDYGIERFDAYQLLTQAGTLYVGNMVDTYYSLVGGHREVIPRRRLIGRCA